MKELHSTWALSLLGGVQIAALVLLGGAAVRADASCGIQCDNGKTANCEVSGTGCGCAADGIGGCTADCSSYSAGGGPDKHTCTPAE
jgi:hypothetical protein